MFNDVTDITKYPVTIFILRIEKKEKYYTYITQDMIFCVNSFLTIRIVI